ncbi:MAG: WYL domain-containing protein [Bacteroidales bacterium]|nr:WYL domain-containing protein [Bacteroidales bacterium]
MKIHHVINRYYLIINKIRSSHYPSFEEIRDQLASHDIDISFRTLQRDLQNIRNEFGIEVVYNKTKNGYSINTEESSDYEYFMRFFEMTVMSGTLTDSLKTGANISRHISFDTIEPMQGVEFIGKILFAIDQQLKIKIKYQRFNDDMPFEANLAPGFLKEYQKRWYLIAWNFDLEAFRTYGLDRIKGFEITGENYNPKLVSGCKDIFDHVIGIGFPDKEPEMIELSFDKEQGKYIKTLPLHKSQTILVDSEKELRILLKVVPNYELSQKIMSYGDRVKVIRPEWLRKEIIKAFENFIKKN